MSEGDKKRRNKSPLKKQSDKFCEKNSVMVALLKLDAVRSSSWSGDRQAAFNSYLHEKISILQTKGQGLLISKHNGDGLIVVCNSAPVLASFGLEIISEIAEKAWPSRAGDKELLVRCALDVNEVVLVRAESQGLDYSGPGAIRVSRIEPIVAAGEMWCTVFALAALERSDVGISFSSLGEKALDKNSGSCNLFRLAPRGREDLSRTITEAPSLASQLSHYGTATLATADLRKIMCRHQGELLEFFFVTAGRHKLLRQTVDSGQVQEIELSEAKLRNYIAQQLEAVYYRGIEHMWLHFDGRGHARPRVCVKAVVVDESAPGKPAVLRTIARSTEVTYELPDGIVTTTENNTGFTQVRGSKKEYLCQDILADALSGKYKANPRIDFEALKENASRLTSGGEELRKREWHKYWDNGRATDTSTCYRSTLIVPMTLVNNDLSQEFRDAFKLMNVGKTIFGFLCFDHVEKDYFDPRADVDMGYFFADLFSLYLVTALGFTSASGKYSEALNFLENRS